MAERAFTQPCCASRSLAALVSTAKLVITARSNRGSISEYSPVFDVNNDGAAFFRVQRRQWVRVDSGLLGCSWERNCTSARLLLESRAIARYEKHTQQRWLAVRVSISLQFSNSERVGVAAGAPVIHLHNAPQHTSFIQK